MGLKIKVYHSQYGCESGCCGHVIEIERPNVTHDKWTFDHPWNTDHKKWAKDQVLDILEKFAPECIDTIDWDSMDISGVSED